MFWRKTRAAIDKFHPAHRELIYEHRASASMPPAEWAALVASLAQHGTLVKRRKWALPKRTESVLVPLVRVLCEDMRPGGTLSITADLRGPFVPEKAGPRVPLGFDRRAVPSVVAATEEVVIDPWLRVRAELYDGSVLELAVTDRVRTRRFVKVNPRGKRKTKEKSKSVRQVSTSRLLPPGAVIRRPATPPPAWMSVRSRDGKRTLLSASAKLTTVDDSALPEQVLDVSTELFRWTPPHSGTAARRTR